MSRIRTGWVLPASLVLALVLGLLPLPLALQPYRPYWLALVLAYWIVETPDRAGLGLAFVCGVVADVVYGGILGEQALRLVVFGFILQRFRARLRFFLPWQQALAIGALHLLLGEPVPPPAIWWTPVLGMLLWPLVFVLLDAVRLGRRGD